MTAEPSRKIPTAITTAIHSERRLSAIALSTRAFVAARSSADTPTNIPDATPLPATGESYRKPRGTHHSADPLRSQRVAEIGTAREFSEDWRQKALAKGTFTELSATEGWPVRIASSNRGAATRRERPRSS